MTSNRKDVPKKTQVNKLSGEASFFRALDWTKHYVDYKTGLIEHDDIDEMVILQYAEYLNHITERGKYQL